VSARLRAGRKPLIEAYTTPGFRADNRLVVQPVTRRGVPRPEVFNDDIRVVAQTQGNLMCAGQVQVDAEVALAGVLLGIVSGDLADIR